MYFNNMELILRKFESMNILDRIKTFADQQFDTTVANRRHIHMHPELSYEEKETAAFVAKNLKEMGISFTENIGGYGLVATITGKKSSKKVLALRADMDALPIVEESQKDYISTKPGIMHACGHDVHTASLLSTTFILNQLKDELQGTVKLIFQPAEEKAPGGASLMIRDGVLKNPDVNAILGQHVAPNVPVGKIGFRPGMYMASTDEIYMRVHGKGGHGAAPHSTIDPILVASHIVVALQQIISRNKNPSYPSVLTIGKFIANGATNIIPNDVYIEGTFRCMNEDWRAEGLAKIQKMAETIADSMGARCEFWIVKGYPFLQNHPELTAKTRASAEKYVGSENIVDLDLWMAGEDFAFYSQQVDACFYRLGTRNEAKGIVSGVHTPTFDVDEESLRIGPGLMAFMAIEELAS
jgi:amidohydrolase